jgi:moderate conductance mechanosensitive channel
MVDPVCPRDGGDLCRLVRSVTHNDWLAKSSDWLIAKPLAILALILIGLLTRWLLHRAIDKVTAQAVGGTVPSILARGGVQHLLEPHPAAAERRAAAAERREQRVATMGGLLKSIVTGVVAAVVLFMAVAQLGYNIAPLIASAGVIGVALGFGAQSLVKDFLSGIFLIMEDQYGVGDAVELGTTSGTVETVGLRVTRLRAVDGTVWYVRNGEILAVGNKTQGSAEPGNLTEGRTEPPPAT